MSPDVRFEAPLERAANAEEFVEPYPDRLLDLHQPATDPAEQASRRMATTLAFVTAVQLLSARQRAVLILRDVLAFSGAEVADLLDTTQAAVDSLLRRARRRLAVEVRDQPPSVPASRSEDDHLVRTFVAAWERADIDGLVALLTQEAVLAMPPMPAWFRGRAAIGEFLATVPADGHLDQIRLIPTRANGQPALAAYAPDPSTNRLQAYGIMVLTTTTGAISALTGFNRPDLFPLFDLPEATHWARSAAETAADNRDRTLATSRRRRGRRTLPLGLSASTPAPPVGRPAPAHRSPS